MTLFRNSRFTTRNYECQNLVWCRAESVAQIKQVMPQSKWHAVPDKDMPASAQQLWKQGPLTFFGWL